MIQKKILLVTGSYGNGHISAANALTERLENEGKIVKIYDLAKESWGGKILKACFNSAPVWLIEFLFHKKNYALPTAGDLRSGKFLFGSGIQNVLDDFHPDEIFSTFPLGNTELRKRFSGKIAVYITDYFSPHFSWGWGSPDEIICLDEKAKEHMKLKFSEISDIRVSSFPLSQKIHKIPSCSLEKKNTIKENLQEKYSLPEKFLTKKIFLLFFHHVLLGNEENIIKNIQKDSQFSEYYIAVIAGKNSDYFSHFSDSSTLHVFSWIDEIASFYAIADAVGGKCGGAFVSEVMFLDLPLLITGVFSGQEKGNKKFLEEKYAHKLIRLDLEEK